MKKYHKKLVRDKIPEICRQNNDEPTLKVLSDSEYLTELDKKLREELEEFLEAHELSEAADLLEVLMATVRARGGSMEDVEKIRISKARERGAFENKIYLVSTEKS